MTNAGPTHRSKHLPVPSAADVLEPVSRKATAAIVAARVRTAIIDGSFEAGSQLGEMQLASALGVSRGPVREAMQRLIQEGLLRSEPNRGVFVVDLEQDDIEDIYYARTVVERAAVQRLLDTKDALALAALNTCMKEMKRAARQRDARKVGDYDLEFHKTLVESSGSKRLNRMFQTLIAETRMCISASGGVSQLDLSVVREHSELLDAVREGNRRRAIALVEKHMEVGIRRRLGQ